MPVLDRTELEASPLADLHAIAGELGLDGFRRLRKADLIDTILGDTGSPASSGEPKPKRSPRMTSKRTVEEPTDEESPAGEELAAERPGRERTTGGRIAGGRSGRERSTAARRTPRGRTAEERASGERASGERVAEGVVEVLAGGSAFLRVHPPGPSDDDLYISAAQVRRCELASGDSVSGPVRLARRSERHPSLTRIDTINGKPADSRPVASTAGLRGSGGAADRYDELPVVFPSEPLAMASKDPTLAAIDRLAPLGRGSRAVIVGATRAGKTEALRRMLVPLAGRPDLEVALVLVGVRPEEIGEWQAGPVAPSATLTFAASADAQGQAVERTLARAKRVAMDGGHAVLLIDSLDGLHPQAARKVLACARNLSDGGSLTVIGTAARPFGGETTVIALDAALASTGLLPALDVMNSGTLRPELLVGEQGAQAIIRARASHKQPAAASRRGWLHGR